jgi:small subunit ribosomal protein S16
MLVIRLQRMGKKKSPSYRLVLSEKTKDTQGRSLEILGRYNPVMTPKVLDLKEERIKHWISKGAQTSETVHNLLVESGIISADKRTSVSISKKRQGNIDKKKAEKQEAVKQAAEAEAAKKVEEVVAAEAPASEEEKTEEVAPEPTVEEKKEKVSANEEEKEDSEGTGRDLSVQEKE